MGGGGRNLTLLGDGSGAGGRAIFHQDMYSGGSAGFENTRLLTILCYLNPDWKPGDGGVGCPMLTPVLINPSFLFGGGSDHFGGAPTN